MVVGGDNRYHFVNSAFERYAGLPRDQILGRTAMDVLGEVEVARRRPWMKRALCGETVRFTLDYATPDGTQWLELTGIPLKMDGGEVGGFVGIGQDVTQQKLEQDRLTDLARRDPLTGLYNRLGFEQQIEFQVRQGRGGQLGLLYIDLDAFKPVNDRHGHAAGDRPLRHRRWPDAHRRQRGGRLRRQGRTRLARTHRPRRRPALRRQGRRAQHLPRPARLSGVSRGISPPGSAAPARARPHARR